MTDSEQFAVVFNQADPSDAVRQRAEYLMGKLAHVSGHIMRCVMTIEGRHRHHHQGNLFHISIRIRLPFRDVVVSKDPERNHAHEDIYVAMRDAVDAAKRQLQRYEEEFGGKHAQHEQHRFENRPEQQPD